LDDPVSTACIWQVRLAKRDGKARGYLGVRRQFYTKLCPLKRSTY
jgi:hypothetical protein